MLLLTHHNRRHFFTLLSALALTLLGCPDGANKTSPAVSKQDAGNRAKPPGAGTASGSATAAVATAKPSAKGASFALPPIEINSRKEIEIAGKKLKATICELDTSAADMSGEMPFEAIRAIIAETNDSIFVLDHLGKIRKYSNVAGDKDCKLELVKKWGTAGVLTIDEKSGTSFNSLAIDKAGNLFAAGQWGGLSEGSFPAEVSRIDKAGKVKVLGCKAGGPITVDPLGTTAFIGSGGIIGKKTFDVGDGTCEPAAFSFKGWPEDSVTLVRPRGDDLLVGGFVKKKDKGKEVNVYKIALHSADGAQKFIAGTEEGDGHICAIAEAHSCGLGLCVFDGNCQKLHAWDTSGKLVGTVSLHELVAAGSPLPAWPVAASSSADFMWLAMIADGKGDREFGFVVRIEGMN